MALSDAPARSNSDMQRNDEARTTKRANAKPRHLTTSDVGEQTQIVSKELKNHMPPKTSPTMRNSTKSQPSPPQMRAKQMLKADTYHVTRHRANVVTNQKRATSGTGPERNLQRPRRAQETKRSVETRTLDKANNCRPQVPSTSDKRPVARSLQTTARSTNTPAIGGKQRSGVRTHRAQEQVDAMGQE